MMLSGERRCGRKYGSIGRSRSVVMRCRQPSAIIASRNGRKPDDAFPDALSYLNAAIRTSGGYESQTAPVTFESVTSASRSNATSASSSNRIDVPLFAICRAPLVVRLLYNRILIVQHIRYDVFISPGYKRNCVAIFCCSEGCQEDLLSGRTRESFKSFA